MVRFNARNPRAEAWIAERSSGLIVQISEDQRRAVRSVLTEALSAGRHPRSTALDIVGRINKTTGRREGGILGLTSGQTRISSNLRAGFTSGDKQTLRAYLGYSLRDRRYDARVRRALAEGRGLSPNDIDTIVGRYNDRMLKFRGDNIALTETSRAVHSGAREGTQQILDTGVVNDGQIKKAWRSSRDGRVRDSHIELNGTMVLFNEPFISPLGSRMMHPNDTSLGALAEDTIRCRCWQETRFILRPN